MANYAWLPKAQSFIDYRRACQPEGRQFDSCLVSQTHLHCEFSALLVDAPTCAGTKIANTRGKSVSHQGAHRWLTRPERRVRAPSNVNLSPSPSSGALLVDCRAEPYGTAPVLTPLETGSIAAFGPGNAGSPAPAN